MTSSAEMTDRERRAARRAALRAVHPDLGGDTEAFVAVMRAFEQSRPEPSRPERSHPGQSGTRTRTPVVVTTSVRSRTARRAHRARRRLRDLAARHPAAWPGRRYTYLSEERA